MTNKLLRWTPAVIAVVAVAGAAIAIPVSANASVSLPDKTPQQVLDLIASSSVTAFSGEITETSDLGLPSLPAGAGGDSGSSSVASALSLITGTNSLRVYVDGPKNVRLQDLEQMGERDVIRHGTDVWVYDSKNNSVSHATVTPNSKSAHPVAPMYQSPDATSPQNATPDGLAKELLSKLETTSTITVGQATNIAGRSAYKLILTPKQSDTLIGSVSIAVDSATGLPLGVDVQAKGQSTPALNVGFTSLSLAKPAASLFNFTPPSGATVKQIKQPDAQGPVKKDAQKPTETVTGTGWDAVVTVSAAGSLADLTGSSEFAELTTAVTGGRVLHTSLVNILFTTDGRVIAGAVPVARLQAVASAS
jgi:outer membrane lipoprotein-sorting protein